MTKWNAHKKYYISLVSSETTLRDGTEKNNEKLMCRAKEEVAVNCGNRNYVPSEFGRFAHQKRNIYRYKQKTIPPNRSNTNDNKKRNSLPIFRNKKKVFKKRGKQFYTNKSRLEILSFFIFSMIWKIFKVFSIFSLKKGRRSALTIDSGGVKKRMQMTWGAHFVHFKVFLPKCTSFPQLQVGQFGSSFSSGASSRKRRKRRSWWRFLHPPVPFLAGFSIPTTLWWRPFVTGSRRWPVESFLESLISSCRSRWTTGALPPLASASGHLSAPAWSYPDSFLFSSSGLRRNFSFQRRWIRSPKKAIRLFRWQMAHRNRQTSSFKSFPKMTGSCWQSLGNWWLFRPHPPSGFRPCRLGILERFVKLLVVWNVDDC